LTYGAAFQTHYRPIRGGTELQKPETTTRLPSLVRPRTAKRGRPTFMSEEKRALVR
jgi:hypothetical protein